MMPELSTEKDRNCRKKTEEGKKGRRFLNLKIRRARKKKIQHFQTARFNALSERRWQVTQRFDRNISTITICTAVRTLPEWYCGQTFRFYPHHHRLELQRRVGRIGYLTIDNCCITPGFIQRC
jgi:IS5 family transposase